MLFNQIIIIDHVITYVRIHVCISILLFTIHTYKSPYSGIVLTLFEAYHEVIYVFKLILINYLVAM